MALRSLLLPCGPQQWAVLVKNPLSAAERTLYWFLTGHEHTHTWHTVRVLTNQQAGALRRSVSEVILPARAK